MAHDAVLVLPAVESLLHIGDTDNLWPEEIKYNRELTEQANARMLLRDSLNNIFSSTARSDQDITEAIDSRVVCLDDAISVYQQLSNFLEVDLCHARIILYLPFELIPSASWRHESERLMSLLNRFVEIYMKRWQELLSVNDVRANFVDGDVFELELRTSPIQRVVKAVHLIPTLMQKGIVSGADLAQLIMNNPHDVFKNSVADILPVLMDNGLLSRLDFERIVVLNNIDMNYRNHNKSLCAKITEARADWLQKEETQKIVEELSEIVKGDILNGRIAPDGLTSLVGGDELNKLACIHGVRKAIEAQARDDLAGAIKMYREHEYAILSLWRDESPNVQDSIACTLSHLFHLKVLSSLYLKPFGLKPINLDDSFQEKRASIEEEANKLGAIIESIETNPELSRFLYPVLILFGSRLKGYGTSTADLDVAVFVKSNISPESRTELRCILSKLFSHDKIKGKVVEFWLAENDGRLVVVDFPNPDAMQAESSWVHVLFEGAWYGQKEAIQELYKKLLSKYLYKKNTATFTGEARRIWLEELEKDTLQYRLMHRGYARYFPESGGINTAHADCIDGKSAFYDSGYRRLATKLFITNVFLPQLEK